jgi:putative membrane protein
MMRYGFNGMFNNMGWLGGGIGVFIGLAITAFLVYGFYVLTRNRQPRSYVANAGSANTGDAIRILNERYARGEISDEEFNRIKDRIINY